MTTYYNIVWYGPKLDRKLDFYYWVALMRTHLRVQNLWSFVEMRLVEGTDDTTRRTD